MASILWNAGEYSELNSWLGGVGATAPVGSPQLIPSASGTVGSWGLGLGTQSGGVGANKANLQAQILELGTTTANGYARAVLTRNQTSWPASTVVSGSNQSTAPQQLFTFTGAPIPNGATLWFLAGDTTIGHDNCLFGADTAAVRTYANGDTEQVTATMRCT